MPLGLAVRRVVVVVSDEESPERLHLMEPSWTGLVAMRAGVLEVKIAEPGLVRGVSGCVGRGGGMDGEMAYLLPSASLKAWQETEARSAPSAETIFRPQTDSISGVES